MGDLERLIEEEAIKRLKARYCRCLDTEDWDGFIAVFAEDIEFRLDLAVCVSGSDPGEPVIMRGKQAMYDSVFPGHQRTLRCHHCHMPEIDILSDTEARGIWAMEDIVEHGTTLIEGAGHYHETYRKIDGEWRIATVHLRRTRYRQVVRDRITL